MPRLEERAPESVQLTLDTNVPLRLSGRSGVVVIVAAALVFFAGASIAFRARFMRPEEPTDHTAIVIGLLCMGLALGCLIGFAVWAKEADKRDR
jgi:hypothetical protein